MALGARESIPLISLRRPPRGNPVSERRARAARDTGSFIISRYGAKRTP